jgi:predicted molibdopterin-dependent oxidoreductase YjgC
LQAALSGKIVVLLDSLPNELSAKASIVLPVSTWAEKAGTFENYAGRLQAFNAAINPIEFTRPEAQIALDLMAAMGKEMASTYDAAETRKLMGGVFTTDVQYPAPEHAVEADMEYVEL